MYSAGLSVISMICHELPKVALRCAFSTFVYYVTVITDVRESTFAYCVVLTLKETFSLKTKQNHFFLGLKDFMFVSLKLQLT